MRLLLIEDDLVDQMAFKRLVANGELPSDCEIAGSVALARDILSRNTPDVIISDYLLGDGTAFDILDLHIDCPVIITTGAGDEEVAVKAIKAGAYDYLIKDAAQNYLKILPVTIEKAIRQKRNEERHRFLSGREYEEALLAGGLGFEETMRLIARAADAESPVLLTGETGTGKSRAAKAIHYGSRVRTMPFMGINCAALPENLIEAELFGYRRGSFTGAVADRKGIFELAEGGTLFLDEIGEMPLHLQSKLLGVLEDKQVRRIGDESARHVNVRIIAATGVDVEHSLGRTFRKDIFYRLSVIRIHMPPLRERRADIPELCKFVLREIAEGRDVRLPDSEVAKLVSYEWPGNIRELKNVLERAVILQGRDLRPSTLLGSPALVCGPSGPARSKGQIPTLAEIEKNHIRQSLEIMSRNVTQTAKALGISLSTLKRKIKEYGLK